MYDKPVILFDGVCNLCNHGVQFIIARDPAQHFLFATLDSDAAQRCLQSTGLTAPLPDSMIVVEGTDAWIRSAAVLRIVRGLRFPWYLAYGLIIIPRPLRDWAYKMVARSRYRWFGKRDVCMVPTPEIRQRFLS